MFSYIPHKYNIRLLICIEIIIYNRAYNYVLRTNLEIKSNAIIIIIIIF